MSETTEPAWIRHARELLELLREQATEDDYGSLLFEGKLQDLYRQTGASNSHYSRIIRLLVGSEVIRFVQRGNKHQPSVIEVTGELQPGALIPPEHLTEARSAATLLADTETAVKSLTAWRESLERGGLDVAKALQDFELRITRLEREVSKLGKIKSKAKN